MSKNVKGSCSALDSFLKVKSYIHDLKIDIVKEDAEGEMLQVVDENRGIKNLLLHVSEPILIIEQIIFENKKDNMMIFKKLLQINRHLVHGALVLDDDGKYVIFRDTLQIKNLDLNELEASINALHLCLVEHGNDLIKFSKGL
ncbi:MAG: molecular chaperone Tir [Oligoflexia bacterium]|nr:molecular chaperone Tir [Oligoflexia bacterium]